MGVSQLVGDEYFVSIRGYERYIVSNLGRVINVVTGKDLEIREGQYGDCYVALYSLNKSPMQVPLRVLVAQAFFVEYEENQEVFLKSQNKRDCSVMNVTLNRPTEPLPEERVTERSRRIRINELDEEFVTPGAAARRIQGDGNTIQKILYGLGKSHKGYTFSYVD